MEAAEASAVAGLYHIITPGAQVRAERAVQVDGTAGEEGVAFARALQRLVALFDIERFIAAQATVENEPGPPARCTIHLWGESYDPARHPYGVEVKAVTHHQLVFARHLRRVAVVLDI
jgi:SHS2 domain-containing protein